MKRSGLPVAGIDVGELPLLGAADDAPFLRPEKRMKVRRGRRGLAARAILTLRLCAVVVIGVAAVWTGYAKTRVSVRLCRLDITMPVPSASSSAMAND